MTIHFNCENGHRIRADEKHAGQQGNCPRCRVPIQVPSPPADQKRPRSITESGVMRVLGDADLAPSKGVATESAKRCCPRCRKPLSAEATLCKHCHLYVGLTAPAQVTSPAVEQINLL
ncbi:MAG: hypothetical protein ACE361_17265 [Aureliella sp.]